MANKKTIEEINALRKGTLGENFDIWFEVLEDDRIEATMPVDERNCQPFGVINGGATIALAETVSGVGSIRLCPEGKRAVGQQVSANHISGAPVGDRVRAVAVPIHLGRRSHVWNVDIFAESTRRLVSTVRVVNCVVEGGADESVK